MSSSTTSAPPIPRPGGFDALTDDFWQNILDVNLLAPVRLDRAFVPSMIARGKGVVVHIGSIAAVMPQQTQSTLAYSTAKGALRTYSKGLARAVASKGVRVNLVSPGVIETSGAQGMMAAFQNNTGGTIEEARQKIMDMLGGITRLAGSAARKRSPSLSPFWPPIALPFAIGGDYLIDGGLRSRQCRTSRCRGMRSRRRD